MESSIQQPSKKLALKIRQELIKPNYSEFDEDSAYYHAIKTILIRDGAEAFDPLNPADQILQNLVELS